MSLQTQNLVMVGLGIENDAPPDERQPQLVDSVHLRWAFKPERGFPWHGYYLFRRKHIPGTPERLLRDALSGLGAGLLPPERYITPHGVIKADHRLKVRDDFDWRPPDPRFGIDLSKGFLFFEFEQPASVSRRVIARIAFRTTGTIIVSAFSFGERVAQSIVRGPSIHPREAILESDAITAVEIRVKGDAPVDAVLLELGFVPVAQDAAKDWESLTPRAISLPLSHPDYPCVARSENVARARAAARDRIHYGDPDPFTLRPTASYNTGSIDVTHNSLIVTGNGTEWDETLVGGALQVVGDPRAYTIMEVMNERKLLLSRGFVRPSSRNVRYVIFGKEDEADAFAQLYDQLVHLVTDGPGGEPMYKRTIRPVQRVHTSGQLKEVHEGARRIEGVGTAWHEDLAGFSLQVIPLSNGQAEVRHGSRTVGEIRTGPIWTDDWVGMEFKARGDAETYVISDVHMSDTYASSLTLDRPYEGVSGDRTFEVVDRATNRIASVEAEDCLALEQPYAGPEWATVAYAIVATAEPSASVESTPRLLRQSPLDTVTLASLHPAVAQELGLYWVDETAESGVAYDYLIMADVAAALGPDLTPGSVGSFFDDDDVDAYIVFNKKREPAPPLRAPTNPRVYALPTQIGPAGARNSAGLTWTLAGADDTRLPDQTVMYDLWRADLPDLEESGPEDAPQEYMYRLITEDSRGHGTPIVVPRLLSMPEPEADTADSDRPGDWPPFRLYSIESGLPDGWYSYRVSGIDLFGRHTPRSVPAAWYQWAPVPEPRPHYYTDPPGDRVVNPYAVRLIDKTPPPPPTGVEAFALDPADPFVLQDAAYCAWRRSVSESTIGLRIRWQWTEAHQQQAPDTREFRIYYQPGRPNRLPGRITHVKRIDFGYSEVVTDIHNKRAAGAYVGCHLRAGRDTYLINMSTADDPLKLGVKCIGRIKDVQPAVRSSCVLSIPEEHDLATDFRDATNWSQRLHVVGYDDHVLETIPAARGGDGEELRGRRATPEAHNPAMLQLDHKLDFSGVNLEEVRLWLETDTNRPEKLYRVTEFGNSHDQGTIVTVNEAPLLVGGASAWVIGPPVSLRRYEVFLPAPDTGTDRPFAPSLAQPIVYARIGVTAADDKEHAADHRVAGSWANRPGNEGRVGPAATVFRVLRTPPEPPVLPPDSEAAYATPADYHGNSYYTFRWPPLEHLKVHIFRALDDSVIKRDWLVRTTRTGLDPERENPRHEMVFPAGWEPDRGREAAAELNRVISADRYAALSSDARILLARLPGNENKAWGNGLQERDWEIRRSRGALSADDSHYFPSEWDTDTLKRETVAAELNGIASLEGYRTLSNDALRVLAGLPGNERAFTQITTRPLDPEDQECTNRPGPDNPADFPIDPGLRIYIDTLPGRSTNRYFYRAAYVDGAQNRSAFSLASPPVCLPNVVPPRAPVITKVLGGDRQITLQWARNREPDFAAYWVYRADSKEAARDLRLMTKVVPPGEPSRSLEDPNSVVWKDTDLPGKMTFYYRVVAVDEAGNVSKPTPPVLAQAYDNLPPSAPAWRRAEWVKIDSSRNEHPWSESSGDLSPAVILEWNDVELACKYLVDRRQPTSRFRKLVLKWQSGITKCIDTEVEPVRSYEYRVIAKNSIGKTAESDALTVPPPPAN